MSAYPPFVTSLDSLCRSLQHGEQKDLSYLLDKLAHDVAEAEDMLVNLPAPLRRGDDQGYCRHVLYADPHGRFTIVYLIWQMGQFSPVHGHQSWCTYRVLQGELSETYYHWDATHALARPSGHARRRPGDIVTALPGLQQIHRLGNDGTQTAISLHIYGVAQSAISSGVNLLVATA